MQTFLNSKVHLWGGDSREVLRGFESNSIHSVVCDPPYALVSIVKRFGGENAAPAQHGADGLYARASAGFMGKAWDTGETAFAIEFWQEVYRVLKPGGHVAAFSGTRSYHRLACAIEDAGFEIRDQLAWIYGSGFPKSHDVSKGIDKMLGAERTKIQKEGAPGYQRSVGNHRPWMDDPEHKIDSDAPATPQAAEWQGWGTALKPAWEPICLARKPLSGTVAANVLEYGTGALNIDGCRVESEKATSWGGKASGGNTWNEENSGLCKDGEARPVAGRWPANIVHDGSDEVVALFPDAPGQQRSVGPEFGAKASVNVYGDYGLRGEYAARGDSGSAARFFYSAKADKEDRIGSKHPTVKPVDLMQWLCRLITPHGGVILDPFAGSGSTGEAAWREGFTCHLIERETEYQADIAERLRLADKGKIERRVRAIKQVASVGPLFGEAA
jgi:DNA modification methylase